MAFVYVGQRRPDQKQSTKWQSINGLFPLCHWRSTSYLILILCLATNGSQARHKSQPNAPSATPATPNADRQVPRLPRKTQVDVSSATPATQMELRCHQVPRLPRKVQVDVAKCHAKVVCDKAVCVTKLCGKRWCVTKLRVTKLCRRRRRRRRSGICNTESKTRTLHKDVGKKLLLNPIKWSALSPRPERPRIQDPARIALRAMLWACWFGVALLAPSMKLEVFIGPSKLSRTVTHIYNIFI